MGRPHIGSYRIFSHPMNNASLRSFPPPPLLFLSPSSSRHSFSPSPAFLSFSFSSRLFSSSASSRASPSRVAFRNLFVIKAAIYFTLIEKIGRLPLAATIYHDRTGSSSASLSTSSPPQKIIMPWMYVPARCNCRTFSRFRVFPFFRILNLNENLKFSECDRKY